MRKIKWHRACGNNPENIFFNQLKGGFYDNRKKKWKLFQSITNIF
jgi:hypothetical protein